MEAISDLPILHDMDADYSPQYVKLARILRDKIISGALRCPDPLPASGVAADYQVSVGVAYAALEMLEANHYLARPKRFQCYRVAWKAEH
jgi:DNA-binding GntR family transcriptional regulator